MTPSISIVTPSFNQGRWVADAIESVLGQGYEALEYVVVDGGSTDGSPEIIRHYADRLAWSVSEPDEGQYDAVAKGFGRTSGEIMGWLNSDDMYLPNALSVVGSVFAEFPDVDWITTLYPVTWNEEGAAIGAYALGGFNRESFYRGGNLPRREWHARSFIQQESTFWRRRLWDRAGGRFEPAAGLAGDFDLWARFYEHADLVGVGALLGGFRVHDQQQTATQLDGYVQAATAVLDRYGRPRPRRPESTIRGTVWSVVGRRYGVQPMPSLGRLPGSYPVTNCIWADGWKLERSYVL